MQASVLPQSTAESTTSAIEARSVLVADMSVDIAYYNSENIETGF